jgi:hypothetical protein
MSEQQSIPIIGTIRGARQLPIPVVTRCIALQTFSGGLSNDTQQQALLDMFCLLPACMFDAERGGFVCDEHGGALGCDEKGKPIPRDYEMIDRANPFNDTFGMDDTEKFTHAVNHIEALMLTSFLAANSQALNGDFQEVKSTMWEEIGAALTSQVRLSTSYVLGRADN